MPIFEEKQRNTVGYANYGWQSTVEQSLGKLNLIAFGYIAGYKDAADQLVEENCQSPFIDAIMFPILFLYRQYLELVFKNIILTAYKDDKEKAEKIIKTCSHKLGSIWIEVKSIYKGKLDKEQIKTVKNLVSEFDKYDLLSFNFRYYFDKELKSTIPKEFSVNLLKLKEEIEKIDNIFYNTYN